MRDVLLNAFTTSCKILSLDLNLRFPNVRLFIVLMPSNAAAAIYSWIRITILGGGVVVFIAPVIGRWAAPWFRFFFVSLVHRSLSALQNRSRAHLFWLEDDVRLPLLRTAGMTDAMNTAVASPSKTRRSDIRPLEVESILTTRGPASPRRPTPAEHIGSPKSAATTLESDESPRPSSSHSRTGSLADVARQGKRFSMNFPIPAPNAPSSRPPSWYNSPVHSPVLAASPAETPSFLNRLAAQERRVLELKEELKQAEIELEKLKKEYAKEEASKKRKETRTVQKLQPLTATIASLQPLEDDEDGSSEWLQKEMERRKELLNGVKSSNRKVFSGSRHLRTLSLLSPERGHFSPALPQPTPQRTRRSEETPTQSQKLVRASTTSDISAAMNGERDDKWEDESKTDANRDAFLKTGRQMAADIKEGLLTFFEDIRQATVGQEGITGTSARITQNTTNGRSNSRTPGPRRAATSKRNGAPDFAAQERSSTSTHGSDPLIDIGASFWNEHGVGADTPLAKPAARANKKFPTHRHSSYITPTQRPKDIDDAWDTWGTPVRQSLFKPSDSNAQGTPNAADSVTSPSAASESTDRTLTPGSLLNFDDPKSSRDSIPWPAIQKLTPSNLRRTASHLMDEWEKSLAPNGRESESVGYLAYPSSAEGTPARRKGD